MGALPSAARVYTEDICICWGARAGPKQPARIGARFNPEAQLQKLDFASTPAR
jgi:hypothetical protein